VFDVDAIVETLDAGKEALRKKYTLLEKKQ